MSKCKNPKQLDNPNNAQDTIERLLSLRGIQFYGLYYNCDEISKLFTKSKGKRVLIKYDPTDISSIIVQDPENDVSFRVPAIDQQYAKNLNLENHKKLLKTSKMNDGNNKIEKYKKQIFDIIKQKGAIHGR